MFYNFNGFQIKYESKVGNIFYSYTEAADLTLFLHGKPRLASCALLSSISALTVSKYSSFNSCICTVKRCTNAFMPITWKLQCQRVCFLNLTLCSVVIFPTVSTYTHKDKHFYCMQSCFPWSDFFQSRPRKGSKQNNNNTQLRLEYIIKDKVANE